MRRLLRHCRTRCAARSSLCACRWSSTWPTRPRLFGRVDQVAGVEAVASGLPVLEIVPQCQADGAEGDVLPGNVGFLEELDLQGLLAGREIQIKQPCPVKDMHLVDVRHVDEGEHLADLDP